MNTILETLEKIKGYAPFEIRRKMALYSLIIVTVTAAFILGYAQGVAKSEDAVVIMQPAMPTQVPVQAQTETASPSTGAYVASRNGSKYHLPWCSGAQRIKEENKIWFDSKEEAERRGFSPAKNCPGI